jgi:hypothetical protein
MLHVGIETMILVTKYMIIIMTKDNFTQTVIIIDWYIMLLQMVCQVKQRSLRITSL